MSIELNQFREVFFEEAADHLSRMESDLLALEKAPGDVQLLHSIFRAVHSIKGNAGMFGFEAVVRFAHGLETVLDVARNRGIQLEAAELSLFLEARDALECLVVATRTDAPLPSGSDELLARLTPNRLAVSPVSVTAGSPQATITPTNSMVAWNIRFEPARDIFQSGMDPLLIIRDLRMLGEVEKITLDASRLPSWDLWDPQNCYLAWDVHLLTDQPEAAIRDIFAFVEDGAVIRIEARTTEVAATAKVVEAKPSESRTTSAHADTASLRVATAKVDKLVDLVGELVIAESMASQILQNFAMDRLPELTEALVSMERSTRELQERIMSVRMIPVGGVFNRFNRVIRDMAAATGKQIRLELSGEEIELDKSVIEQLADPLTHLVRNCADHGLETPAERSASGKSETGTIHMEAFHEGGNVLIEVRDDGRGLNTDRIRQKALEKGLIGEDAVLTEDQIHNLIFQPGFSTAAEVSDLSGRGVGMDVVRRNVESLNGAIQLSSRQGKGVKFRVKLPLTLAILDGLSVKVGSQCYILPLVSILESIRPQPKDVKTLANQSEMVVLRGEALALLRLHRLFGVLDAMEDPTKGAVVIVDYDGRRAGFLVDELLGQQQVVIKNLEANFRKVDGVMGATILGDGKTALILDVPGVLQLAQTCGPS